MVRESPPKAEILGALSRMERRVEAEMDRLLERQHGHRPAGDVEGVEKQVGIDHVTLGLRPPMRRS